MEEKHGIFFFPPCLFVWQSCRSFTHTQAYPMCGAANRIVVDSSFYYYFYDFFRSGITQQKEKRAKQTRNKKREKSYQTQNIAFAMSKMRRERKQKYVNRFTFLLFTFVFLCNDQYVCTLSRLGAGMSSTPPVHASL